MPNSRAALMCCAETSARWRVWRRGPISRRVNARASDRRCSDTRQQQCGQPRRRDSLFPYPASLSAFAMCATAEVTSKTMSMSSKPGMPMRPSTPAAVAGTPRRVARASPPDPAHGGCSILDGEARPARSSWRMLEDECLLGFHTWGDESVRRNAPIGLDDHLVEQESEVRLVDPELTLHHLRGQPHFVPAQHAARAEQVSAQAGLDPGRPRRWSARTAFGERGDRDTPACGSEEIAARAPRSAAAPGRWCSGVSASFKRAPFRQ